MTKRQASMWGDGYQVWLCDHIHNIHRLRHRFFNSPCDNFCHLCDKTYPSSVASATTLCDHSYPLCDHIHNPPPSGPYPPPVWPYAPPVWPYPPPVWAAPCPCLHLSPVAVVTRGPAWDRGATNQIVSTHFYPGFVSWLVKLAPVAQISWHPHPSHHRPIQRLSIRIQVTSSPLHVYHLYTHMGILIDDNQRTEHFKTLRPKLRIKLKHSNCSYWPDQEWTDDTLIINGGGVVPPDEYLFLLISKWWWYRDNDLIWLGSFIICPDVAS